MSITFNRYIICFPSSWKSSRFNHIFIHKSAGNSSPVFPPLKFWQRYALELYTSTELRLFCGGQKGMILEKDCCSNQQTRVAGWQHRWYSQWGLYSIILMVRVFALKVPMLGWNFSSLLEPNVYKHLSMNGFFCQFQIQVFFQIHDISIYYDIYFWDIIHVTLSTKPLTDLPGWWKAKTPWFRIQACQEAPWLRPMSCMFLQRFLTWVKLK